MKQGLFSHIHARLSRNRLGELLVQRGKLSHAQLQDVLSYQKKTGRPIGQSAIELNFLTQKDIRRSLNEQMAYRFAAAVLTIFIGFSASFMPSARALTLNTKTQFTQQSMVHKASYGNRSVKPLESTTPRPQLFGTREVASKDITPFKKWVNILQRLKSVSFKPERLEQFQGLGMVAKIVAVNDYVNQFRYIEDKDNFGKSDYWATPTEFFARGGDCEDFAIAKYALLKELGIPEHQMRLAIVQDKIKNIPHAILIVYTNGSAMVLDNQMKTTREVSSVDRYKPIYSINAEGWWRHLS